jgi:formate dehydrogenase maturation protein FdhE
VVLIRSISIFQSLPTLHVGASLIRVNLCVTCWFAFRVVCVNVGHRNGHMVNLADNELNTSFLDAVVFGLIR